MRVIFLGPPGAGKGTQAKLLERELPVCRISTGDILRQAVRDETSLGKQAGEYIDKGELVPDEIMLNLIRDRLQKSDCKAGFVLDGFPRTPAQAKGLDAILKHMGSKLDCVLSMQVPHEMIVQRLAGRRTCERCGALYHMVFNPPRKKNVCDRCHGRVVQREDDREETIEARLRVYEARTAPLIDYYRDRGLLKEIDGVGSVEEINGRILPALEEVKT